MNCKNKYKKGGCCADSGRGCKFCNCGKESTATPWEGHYKLHSTDWLEDMPNVFPTDIFEVRFKNTRKSYYKNVNNLQLAKGDIIAVEASPGHDIGIISLTGDMVARQMKRVNFNPMNGEFKKIYRKAKAYDIEKWQESIAMEHETMIRARQITAELNLNMKIGDVEYQGDRIKAIFYYIADERVDFRELIKVFAEQFCVRVEMKQIGARQEAGRIGGLGSCGRQLCCASWMSNFVSVTTNSARSQEISLNPQKLAGQCGKLKCCLVYELDSYIDARKSFPRITQPLQALDGEYHLFKNDLLAGTMTFSTTPHSMIGLVSLPIRRVKEILEINKRGQKVETLLDEQSKPKVVEEPSFINMIEADSITRFDSTKSKNGKSRKRQNGDVKPRNGNGGGNNSGNNSNNGNNDNKREAAKGDVSQNGSQKEGQQRPANKRTHNPQKQQHSRPRVEKTESKETNTTQTVDAKVNNNVRANNPAKDNSAVKTNNVMKTSTPVSGDESSNGADKSGQTHKPRRNNRRFKAGADRAPRQPKDGDKE